ncbi:MAG: hypothetical protein ACLGH4_00195 [Actinomycetes bacterium]
MGRLSKQQFARRERRITRGLTAVGVLIAGFLLYALVMSLSAPRESRFDAGLPNPMGGPARTAPGDATGQATLAGLTIAGVDVAMGEVALGVTYVPGWQIINPTDTKVSFLVGQPQVLEGCCPGPVYADGELTQAGQELTVAPGGQLLLQFPLQMHPGMDGPHHLAVPLLSGDEQRAVHVTGNFSASARP